MEIQIFYLGFTIVIFLFYMFVLPSSYHKNLFFRRNYYEEIIFVFPKLKPPDSFFPDCLISVPKNHDRFPAILCGICSFELFRFLKRNHAHGICHHRMRLDHDQLRIFGRYLLPDESQVIFITRILHKFFITVHTFFTFAKYT